MINCRTLVLGLALLVVTICMVGCPDRAPMLAVSASSHHFGIVGGNTYETTWEFQVWNDGCPCAPLVFNIATDKPWISVDPPTGQSVDADDKIAILVTIDRDYSEAKDLPDFLSGAVTVTSDVGNEVIYITTAPDYFTQEFAAGLDIANKSFTFTPNGSPSFYGALQEEATAFPTDPTDGVELDFSLGDPIEINPWYGESVYLYGIDYNKFFVSKYGYLTFGPDGDIPSQPFETLEDHFSTPRISGLSSVDAGEDGVVSVLQDADKMVVTFENVSTAADKAGSNNFQVEMFFDGTIRLTYLDMDVPEGIVGLSYGPGDGVPTDFLPSDFTSYNTGGLKAAR